MVVLIYLKVASLFLTTGTTLLTADFKQEPPWPLVLQVGFGTVCVLSFFWAARWGIPAAVYVLTKTGGWSADDLVAILKPDKGSRPGDGPQTADDFDD